MTDGKKRPQTVFESIEAMTSALAKSNTNKPINPDDRGGVMSNHTTAWEVRQAPSINSRDYDIYAVGASASYGKIARVHGREGHHATTIANARLIAAAPDLLDALEESLTDLELSHMREPDGEIRVELGKTIIKARAAIAKARGQL